MIPVNRPSWKDAPEWAKYLAMDRNGLWYWFEERPFYLSGNGTWSVDFGLSRVQCATNQFNDLSAMSLVKRPEEA
jgi:hypothetical protein